MRTPPTLPVAAVDTPPEKSLLPPAARGRDTKAAAHPPESDSDLDEEALWAEARAAALADRSCSDSDVGDSSSPSSSDDDAPRRGRGRASFRLPNGDVHVCRRGVACPYLVSNQDRIMVCSYTGVEHGAEMTHEAFDLSNGIGQRTADQDALCGETVHGKYVRRADPVAASRAAYDAAEMLDEESTHFSALSSMGSAALPVRERQRKRMALCVGENAASGRPRASRSGKRNVSDHRACQNLQKEAEDVLCKLINYQRASSFKQKRQEGRARSRKAAADPRACDRDSVYRESVRRYACECAARGVAAELDTLHDLSLMADAASRRAREEAAGQQAGGVRTAKFRRLAASLVVALWAAMCSTPHMQRTRRGSDAYRPYVCGVFYGMKRSVQLQCGGVLVPACPQLAAALPQLRTTGGNSVAKTLHSSAHRGLCTLSRCIASVPVAQQRVVFADVLRIAKTFDSTIFRSSDV